jgi:hypothetical protein
MLGNMLCTISGFHGSSMLMLVLFSGGSAMSNLAVLQRSNQPETLAIQPNSIHRHYPKQDQ